MRSDDDEKTTASFRPRVDDSNNGPLRLPRENSVMSNKTVSILIASVGGVVAAIALSRGVKAPTPNRASTASVEIFVSVGTIDFAEAITPAKVRLEKWPADRIPQGASSKLADFEGKFARQRFYEGEPIMSVKLMDEVADSTNAIPRGYRVVSVPSSNRNNVASRLRRGDLVDVVAYFKKSDRFSEPTAKTVLTGVRIFAVDDTEDHEAGFIDINAPATRSISLLIHRQDAPAWTCASELGSIRLPLANPSEIVESVDDAAPSHAATEFLTWLAQHQPTRKIQETGLMQTAATSSLPTLVSVPPHVAVPTLKLETAVAAPTPIAAAKEEAKSGFKMIKMSGGVQTEYWIQDGTQVPVITRKGGR